MFNKAVLSMNNWKILIGWLKLEMLNLFYQKYRMINFDGYVIDVYIM